MTDDEKNGERLDSIIYSAPTNFGCLRAQSCVEFKIKEVTGDITGFYGKCFAFI